MITMTIGIDITEVESYIDSRITKLSRPEMGLLLNGEVFEYLADRVSSRFASSGDSASGSWAPISDAALKSRKVNASPEPLIDTGALRTWAEDPPGTLASNAGGYSILEYPTIAPSDLITNYEYLMAQFGINNTFGVQGLQTPARPIFAVDEVDLSGIMLIVMFHVLER